MSAAKVAATQLKAVLNTITSYRVPWEVITVSVTARSSAGDVTAEKRFKVWKSEALGEWEIIDL